MRKGLFLKVEKEQEQERQALKDAIPKIIKNLKLAGIEAEVILTDKDYKVVVHPSDKEKLLEFMKTI